MLWRVYWQICRVWALLLLLLLCFKSFKDLCRMWRSESNFLGCAFFKSLFVSFFSTIFFVIYYKTFAGCEGARVILKIVPFSSLCLCCYVSYLVHLLFEDLCGMRGSESSTLKSLFVFISFSSSETFAGCEEARVAAPTEQLGWTTVWQLQVWESSSLDGFGQFNPVLKYSDEFPQRRSNNKNNNNQTTNNHNVNLSREADHSVEFGQDKTKEQKQQH